MTADTGRSRDEGATTGADGQNPALVRALKIAVTVMGIMIVVGLGAVIWRIVDLASSPKAESAATTAPTATGATPQAALPGVAWPADLDVDLPDGATVRSTTLSGNRLALHYEHADGPGVAIIDLETGKTLTRVRVKQVRRPPAQ